MISALATSALSFTPWRQLIRATTIHLGMALTLVTERLAIFTQSLRRFLLWGWLFLRHRIWFVLLTIRPFSLQSIKLTPTLALGTKLTIIPTYTIA
jgi:hypothetical protein